MISKQTYIVVTIWPKIPNGDEIESLNDESLMNQTPKVWSAHHSHPETDT